MKKIQFSKDSIRCIIKAEEDDIFEYNGAGAKRARYFKQDKEGVAAMCKMLEDIADYTELSLDTIKELEIQTMQLA